MLKTGTSRHPILTFSNARIIFPNFLGRPTRFNEDGERNFGIEIPHSDVLQLREEGWPIVPGNRGDQDIYVLRVKIPATQSICAIRIFGTRVSQGLQIDELDYAVELYADVEVVLWKEFIGKKSPAVYLIDFDGRIK